MADQTKTKTGPDIATLTETDREQHNRLRDQFAMESFKAILANHLGKGTAFSEAEAVGTWAYKLADSAMRGRAISHNVSAVARGVTTTAQPPPALVPAVAPAPVPSVLAEIK